MLRSAVFSLAVGAVFVSSAWADRAPPPPPPLPAALRGAPLTVKPTEELSRIEIPRRFLAGGAAAPGAERQGALGAPGLRTIIAGVALSLAAAALIFWRGRGKAVPAAAAAVLIVAGTLSSAAAAYANAPAPGFSPGLRIEVVVVERGEQVVLHMNPDLLVEAEQAFDEVEDGAEEE